MSKSWITAVLCSEISMQKPCQRTTAVHNQNKSFNIDKANEFFKLFTADSLLSFSGPNTKFLYEQNQNFFDQWVLPDFNHLFRSELDFSVQVYELSLYSSLHFICCFTDQKISIRIKKLSIFWHITNWEVSRLLQNWWLAVSENLNDWNFSLSGLRVRMNWLHLQYK
jgi:hypothetical protein